MRKGSRKRLKAALVCAVIGAGCCIAGLCLGFTFGDFYTAIEAGKFQVIGQKIIQKNFVNQRESTTKEYEQIIQQEIENLDLDLKVGDCTLHIYDGDDWRISGENLPSGFRCRVKDSGTLKIDCSDNEWKVWENQSDVRLDIYIPQDHFLKKIDLDTGVGDIRTEQSFLKCRKLDLDSDVGDVELYLDAEKEVDIDGGVGAITVTLHGTMLDYDFDVDSGVGEIILEDNILSGFGDRYKLDNGADCKVDLDSGVGKITILFDEGKIT